MLIDLSILAIFVQRLKYTVHSIFEGMGKNSQIPPLSVFLSGRQLPVVANEKLLYCFFNHI